jgi:hypothetical protein
MKLKRDQFKVILKECILELVREGKLFQEQKKQQLADGSIGSRKLNEVIETSNANGVTPNTRLNEAVKLTANLISKGDPKKAAMYESLIADTARTTLQKQLASQMTGGGALMEGAVLPEERAIDQAQLGMFAANQRWAQLAFGGKPKKPTE